MSKARYIIQQRIKQKKSEKEEKGSEHAVLPTERLKRICEKIGLLGCVSLEQLHKSESRNITKQSFRDKMNDLVKAGYVKVKIVDARHKPETVYYLFRNARSLFSSDEWKKLQTKMPATSEQRSVLRTYDILLKVQEAFRIVKFATEHQLKSEKSRNYHNSPQVADGRLTIQKSGEESPPVTIAIEVDGNYHGKSLRSKIASLGKSGQKVIWVAYSRVRVERLTALCQEYPNITPVLFGNLNSLLNLLW